MDKKAQKGGILVVWVLKVKRRAKRRAKRKQPTSFGEACGLVLVSYQSFLEKSWNERRTAAGTGKLGELDLGEGT